MYAVETILRIKVLTLTLIQKWQALRNILKGPETSGFTEIAVTTLKRAENNSPVCMKV